MVAHVEEVGLPHQRAVVGHVDAQNRRLPGGNQQVYRYNVRYPAVHKAHAVQFHRLKKRRDGAGRPHGRA